MTIAKSIEKPMTVCALLLSCLLVPATTNAQSSKPVFGMAVFLSSHFGPEIESGKVDAAIEALESEEPADPDDYERSSNLCVAYIKAKDLQKATNACDEAVRQVQNQTDSLAEKKFVPRKKRVALKEDLAVALSNQGVVTALNGDLEQAEKLFQESIELVSRDKMVKGNLERLNYSPYASNEQED